MSNYPEILKEVQKMTISDQFKLLDDLQKALNQDVEVEDTDEVFSQSEIAESERAWQDYLTGKDKGISSSELKKKLLIKDNV
jgi:hypothetical protein